MEHELSPQTDTSQTPRKAAFFRNIRRIAIELIVIWGVWLCFFSDEEWLFWLDVALTVASCGEIAYYWWAWKKEQREAS